MSNAPHRLCAYLRELRKTAGLSLSDMQERHGVNAIRVGSYERGDRVPPLPQIDSLFHIFGYELGAVPLNSHALRRTVDAVSDLRAIADQWEALHLDVSSMPDSGTQPPRLHLPPVLHLPT